MARYDFGGTLADFVVTSRRLGGLDVLGLSAATLTFWSAQSGGTRYTDLTLNGSAASSISVGTDGQVPKFQGPDGITEMWADGGSPRVRVVTLQGAPGPAGKDGINGANGIPGVNAVANDTAAAGYITTPGSATKTALDAAYVSYAPAPSGGNDQPALQALIDSLAAGNGGVLLLRRGIYRIDTPLYVKNKVTVRGQGRSATSLQAGPTFPTGTFLCKLGDTTGFAFGSRLTNVSLDAGGVTNSKGVFADHAQEMSGLSYVTVSNFTLYGVHLATGTDNYDCDNIELYPAAGGATAGFYGQGNQGANNLRRVTTGVSAALTTGVWIQNGSINIQSVHAENCVDGVLFDGSNGSITGVTGPTASANVTNLVRMANTSRYLTVQAVTKNSSTNAIRDDFFGRTITDAFVQHAVLGDSYIARLNHNGDKLGFFNTAQVAKAGALTDIKAAIASYGLLTAGSAAPLNLEGGGLSAGAGTFTGTLTAAIANFSGLATFNAGATIPSGQALNLHTDTTIQRNTGGAILASCIAPFEVRLTVAGGRVANFNANPGAGAQSPSIGLKSNGTDGPVLGADGGFAVTYLDNAFGSGTKLALRVRGVEALAVGNGNTVGFYGTAPVAKPTITGSRGGNAALASLLTALAGQGLIVDTTTA